MMKYCVFMNDTINTVFDAFSLLLKIKNKLKLFNLRWIQHETPVSFNSLNSFKHRTLDAYNFAAFIRWLFNNNLKIWIRFRGFVFLYRDTFFSLQFQLDYYFERSLILLFQLNYESTCYQLQPLLERVWTLTCEICNSWGTNGCYENHTHINSVLWIKKWMHTDIVYIIWHRKACAVCM